MTKTTKSIRSRWHLEINLIGLSHTIRSQSTPFHVDEHRIVSEENFQEHIRDPLIFLIFFLANECLQKVVLGRVDVSVCLKSTTWAFEDFGRP